MKFHLIEYEEGLNKLSLEEVRTVLKELHKAITRSLNNKPEPIFKKIEEGKDKKKCKSRSTYKNYILDPSWPAQKKRSGAKEGAIQFISYLFTEYTYYAAYQKDPKSGQISIGWANGPQIIPYKIQENSGVTYDCFYWRTNQNAIGVATLFIYDDWSKARMIFHYKKKAKISTYLMGDVWQKEKNIYIHLQDDDELQNPVRPIKTLIVLFASPDQSKRQYLLACFSSVHRDSDTPVAGLLVLHKTDNQDRPLTESPYLIDSEKNPKIRQLINIPDEIAFMLANRRLKVAERVIQVKEELPTFTMYNKLKDFAGTYQAYYFTFHGAQHFFKSRRTEIGKDGLVRSFKTNTPDDYEEGLLRCYGESMIIQFQYKEAEDTYRYYYFLELDDKNHLRGIFAGVADNGLLASGKIFLNRLGDTIVQNQFTLISPDEFHPEVARTFDDAVVANFFGMDGKSSYKHLTDGFLPEYLVRWKGQPLLPSASLREADQHPDMQGTFNCYCLTKDTQKVPALPDKDIYMELLPIFIMGNVVTMKHGTKEFGGTVTFDGEMKLRLTFEHSYYTMLFSVPLPGSSQAEKLQHVYGVMSTINERSMPEASVAVLVKVQKKFENMKYRRLQEIKKLLPIEAENLGIVSFLFGDWGRFIRAPSTPNGKFQTKYDTYRRTFWAAACYWGRQYQLTKNEEHASECIQNLTRAYRQAFGMSTFGDTTLGSPHFPKGLTEDRRMLFAELNDSLNFRQAHEVIASLWMRK